MDTLHVVFTQKLFLARFLLELALNGVKAVPYLHGRYEDPIGDGGAGDDLRPQHLVDKDGHHLRVSVPQLEQRTQNPDLSCKINYIWLWALKPRHRLVLFFSRSWTKDNLRRSSACFGAQTGAPIVTVARYTLPRNIHTGYMEFFYGKAFYPAKPNQFF